MVTRRGFHLKGEATVGANIFKGLITFLQFQDGTYSIVQIFVFLPTASIVLITAKFLWDGEALLSISSFQGNWLQITCLRSEMESTWTQSCWVLGYHSSLESCSHFYHVQLISTKKFLEEYFYSTLPYECNQICTHPEWYFSHMASDFHNVITNIQASHSVIPLQSKEESSLCKMCITRSVKYLFKRSSSS